MKSLFEQRGGTYSTVVDYCVPNLRVLYVNLLTSGNLTEHLSEIDAAATERHETTIRQMATVQGVTENLKATDQMAWVGAMNNIRACADEIVLNELIYD